MAELRPPCPGVAPYLFLVPRRLLGRSGAFSGLYLHEHYVKVCVDMAVCVDVYADREWFDLVGEC